ncbi:MAG: murein biosynthesis integral membrane protein MurJ [Desulfobacterales bacterium]|jgi:putative peptidoglycan lipid II flippase|nr:murein biosynthesis integral membrane protein MurJ [Desulfobacteraceae bacterium]MBT7086933.1 murein biosynthesis integral membrane protein MurJ [Desulfobacterales bacterium]
MSEKSKLTRAAGIVGGATFLSRIFGYIRDMVMAAFFGAGFFSDAFIAAFRIPNLFRRLFAEGSLTIAFIPVFTEYITEKGRDDAFELARSALRLLSIILAITAIAGVLFAPQLMDIITHGFHPEKLSLTVTLTRIMFPYIFFICLMALCMGILNALNHFASPALAPLLLNISMIAAMYIASYISDDDRFRIIGLAVGVLAGGVLQLSFQIPFLVKNGFYFWQKAKIYHPGLKKIGVLMIPAVFGAAVYQINILVGTFLASLLPGGSITYLYYSDRLVQFPLGVFAISIGTAILPSLSRHAANNDFHALRDTFAYSIRLIFFITLPSMVGLIVLRKPIIALLFQRGAFTAESVIYTADALLYYCAGLWAVSAVRVIVPTFYALKDTKTPVRIGIISIISNIALGIILMKHLSHCGLALATSLASIINFCLLIVALRKKLGSLGWKKIIISTFKSFACSVIMGIVVMWVIQFLIPDLLISDDKTDLSILLPGLMGGIAAGVITYILLSIFFKSHELYDVIGVVKKRFIKE